MPISQWILPQVPGLAVLLALILTHGLTAPSSGETVSRRSESRAAVGDTGFLAPAAETIADLIQAITSTPWKGVAVGPEIVTGEASCPRSAGGDGVDCAAAARAVCARAGFREGFQVGTATRRVCRGSETIAGTDEAGADCRSKTSTTRALCW